MLESINFLKSGPTYVLCTPIEEISRSYRNPNMYPIKTVSKAVPLINFKMKSELVKAISPQTVILRPLGLAPLFSSFVMLNPVVSQTKGDKWSRRKTFWVISFKSLASCLPPRYTFLGSTAARYFFKNSCISKSKCGSTVVHFLWNGVEPPVSTCSTKQAAAASCRHRGSLKTLWKIASKSRWRQGEELFLQVLKEREVLMCIGKSP